MQEEITGYSFAVDISYDEQDGWAYLVFQEFETADGDTEYEALASGTALSLEHAADCAGKEIREFFNAD